GSFLGVQHSTRTLGEDDAACCQDWFLSYALYPITNSNPPSSASIRFSSEHDGGAQFLMADGSVRFISENVDHILETTGLDTNHTAARGAGCLWRSEVGGCSDG
ncbi:MAG TPA: hypothetical protein DIW81_08610, partial [Planctomycetaceae bacterium]|nr:hypothetical protein [Planctomycetaceae bacterium]